MDFIITTSSKAEIHIINKAREFSDKLSIPFIARDNQSLRNITKIYSNKGVFLVEKNNNKLIFGTKEYFFHPGMAKLRIRELKNGHNDLMVDAMNLTKGDTILDCTLGLASDAIVASYFLGDGCKIVGLEAVDVLATIVSEGLNKYVAKENDINEAMRRIEVLNINHKEFLLQTPNNAFDILYFDPMFKNTIKESSGIQALKPFVYNQGIDVETISLAKSKARKKIVIKERAYSKEFTRLGCNRILGGKYSKVAYGIIDIT